MAIKTPAVIKTYFEKGDRPTQQQFWDLIDTALNVLTLTFIAGETLGGQRLVYINGGMMYYFDKSYTSFSDKIIGITNQSALAGENIDIVTDGVIVSNGWGLITDSIYYAGTNGIITTTIPTSGVLFKVGKAIDPNTLMIEFSEPIILA